MEEKLRTTEARQGDRRRMNMRVLFWSLPAAAILLAILAAFRTQSG
jgi:hypothetical protein